MTNDNDPDPDAPQSAADPRPNGEPYYIDAECPGCDTRLVLSDEHRPTGDGSGARVAPEVWDARVATLDEPWHDEWVCPECEDGIHMDWPDSERERIFAKAAVEEGTYTPLDEAGEDDGDE